MNQFDCFPTHKMSSDLQQAMIQFLDYPCVALWASVRMRLATIGEIKLFQQGFGYLVYGIEVVLPCEKEVDPIREYRLKYLERICVRYLMQTCWNYDWKENKLVV